MILPLSAADFCFPSPINPAEKAPTELSQYIMIMWENNIYTGMQGTYYNHDASTSGISNNARIGKKPFKEFEDFPITWPITNPLKLEAGDIGMLWAVEKLRTPMTFSMVSGMYVPIENPPNIPDLDNDGIADSWAFRESQWGYWEPTAIDSTAGYNPLVRVPVSWGVEQQIKDSEQIIQPNCYTQTTNKALNRSHEIANNTFDYLTPDSPLPGGDRQHAEKGFGLWNNEGYDNSSIDTMPWGEIINEAAYLGQIKGETGHRMGWKIKAGEYLSENAWSRVLDLSEEWLLKSTELEKKRLYGFSAPRSEVNSNLYKVLWDKEYLYDASIHEGYEEHRNGSNFLWPYTMGNGSPNSWIAQSLGKRRMIDDIPSGCGLWQIPLNPVIVPEEIREAVWTHHEFILKESGTNSENPNIEKSQWMQRGLLPPNDLIMYEKWGMTKEHWIKTMQHTLELRLKGNKAPFHFRANSHMYTPTYDFQPRALNGTRRLPISTAVLQKWNNWRGRINAMEEWISWSKGKGCEFVTGTQLINEVIKLSKQAPTPYFPVDIKPTFYLYVNDSISNKTKASAVGFKGDANIDISIAAPENEQYPFAAYRANLQVEKLTHLSLDYQISNGGALCIRFIFDGEPNREVILNNSNSDSIIQSGMIPFSAFDYHQYEYHNNITYDKADFSNLIALEIQPLAPVFKTDGSNELRTEPFDMSFKIENIKLYAKPITPVLSNKHSEQDLTLTAISSKRATIQVPQTGHYTVEIRNMRGQTIQAILNNQLSAGTHSFTLRKLSKGIYLISIRDNTGNKQVHKRISIL